MFGYRKDGKKIKEIDGFYRIASLLMGKTRSDSTNMMYLYIPTKKLDEFIAKKKREGLEYTYRDIFIATLVRLFHVRPRLNRFVYGGNFYQRHFVDAALPLHKNLRTGEQETTMKCRFTGKETLAEVKAVWDSQIKNSMSSDNGTDDFARLVERMPTWMLRIMVGMMRFFDRHGLLTRKFMENASPFHASFFFTDMKSILMDASLHHLYDFGNCGLFVCLGKEKLVPVVDQKTGEIKAERVVTLGVSEDERFMDGLYLTNMYRSALRIFGNLSVLERAPTDNEIIQPALNAYWRTKKEKKAAKKAKKEITPDIS